MLGFDDFGMDPQTARGPVSEMYVRTYSGGEREYSASKKAKSKCYSGRSGRSITMHVR